LQLWLSSETLRQTLRRKLRSLKRRGRMTEAIAAEVQALAPRAVARRRTSLVAS